MHVFPIFESSFHELLPLTSHININFKQHYVYCLFTDYPIECRGVFFSPGSVKTRLIIKAQRSGIRLIFLLENEHDKVRLE